MTNLKEYFLVLFILLLVHVLYGKKIRSGSYKKISASATKRKQSIFDVFEDEASFMDQARGIMPMFNAPTQKDKPWVVTEIDPGLEVLMRDLRAEMATGAFNGPFSPTTFYKQFRRQPGEYEHLTPMVPIAWYPAYCRAIGFQWDPVKILSRGSNNTVSLIKERGTGKLAVLKAFGNPDEYSNELHFFTVAQHPFLVKPICHQKISWDDASLTTPEQAKALGFVDGFRPGADGMGLMRKPTSGNGNSRPAIIMEYLDGYVSAQKYASCCASEEDLVRIILNIAAVIEYLHWLGYSHSDIKPRNIMVHEETLHTVLIDYGFTTRKEYVRKGRGTPATISPELAYRAPGKASFGADMWAFGVLTGMLFGTRLHILEAIDRLAVARETNPSANIREFLEPIKPIPSYPPSSEHVLQDPLPTSYIPICYRNNQFERQLTPPGFSPALRRFILKFLSIDPEERLFNTPRLWRIIYDDELFMEYPELFRELPSPLLQGPEMFLRGHGGEGDIPTPTKMVESDEDEEEQHNLRRKTMLGGQVGQQRPMDNFFMQQPAASSQYDHFNQPRQPFYEPNQSPQFYDPNMDTFYHSMYGDNNIAPEQRGKQQPYVDGPNHNKYNQFIEPGDVYSKYYDI